MTRKNSYQLSNNVSKYKNKKHNLASDNQGITLLADKVVLQHLITSQSPVSPSFLLSGVFLPQVQGVGGQGVFNLGPHLSVRGVTGYKEMDTGDPPVGRLLWYGPPLTIFVGSLRHNSVELAFWVGGACNRSDSYLRSGPVF